MSEDERALRAFVRRDSHLAAMDALRSHMADVAFIRWKVKGADIPLTWVCAMRHADSRST